MIQQDMGGIEEMEKVVEVIKKKEWDGYHDGAHMKFTVALNSLQGLVIWKVIILHK